MLCRVGPVEHNFSPVAEEDLLLWEDILEDLVSVMMAAESEDLVTITIVSWGLFTAMSLQKDSGRRPYLFGVYADETGEPYAELFSMPDVEYRSTRSIIGLDKVQVFHGKHEKSHWEMQRMLHEERTSYCYEQLFGGDITKETMYAASMGKDVLVRHLTRCHSLL